MEKKWSFMRGTKREQIQNILILCALNIIRIKFLIIFLSYKVLDHILVRFDDYPSSQKQEMIVTKRFYGNFDSENETIKRHAHDRNSSVNKFIKEKKSQVQTKMTHGMPLYLLRGNELSAVKGRHDLVNY